MESVRMIPFPPFVSQFYGYPSTYTWEDDEGVVHEITQREGGDALMPALFSLGQHNALEAIQARLRPDERLMAFCDCVARRYVSSPTGARGEGLGDPHGVSRIR